MRSLGDRIRSQLKKLGISQAELARRVGVTQPAINDLVSGKSHSSKHLHKIARELKTTVEFLAGETDDPYSDSTNDLLTSQERRDLELLRRLPARDREAIRQLMRTISAGTATPTPAPAPASATVHSPSRSFAGRDLSKGEAA